MAWQGSVASAFVSSDDSTLSTIATIPIPAGASNLWIELYNQPHKAFDKFQLQIRPTADSTFYPVAVATSDFVWSSDIAGLPKAVVDPTSLALNTSDIIYMGVKGLDAVRLQASAAAQSDTYADVKWSVR